MAHRIRKAIEEALLLLAYHIVQRAARIEPKPALKRVASAFNQARNEL